MIYIYYFLVLLFGGAIEIKAILSPKDTLNESQELRIYNKARKLDPKTKTPSCVYTGLLYFALTFLGLLSSQWPLFIVLLLLGFIPKKWVLFIVFDGIISLILILMIVINKFHLHYNLTHYVISFFV